MRFSTVPGSSERSGGAGVGSGVGVGSAVGAGVSVGSAVAVGAGDEDGSADLAVQPVSRSAAVSSKKRALFFIGPGYPFL